MRSGADVQVRVVPIVAHSAFVWQSEQGTDNAPATPDVHVAAATPTKTAPPALQQDWYSVWRVFSPWGWETNLSKWDEPPEPEGQPLAPYMERVCYYLATRHPVLTCVFVEEDDSFSRNERIAAFVVTILNTWWVAIFVTKAYLTDDEASAGVGLRKLNAFDPRLETHLVSNIC